RERGIWYGSETPHSVFAEVAYYRLVFLEGTEADLSPLMVELSLFRVSIRTEHGIDLTAPPFDAWREVVSSKTDYSETQALGHAMRDDGVEAFRYPSARDARGGVNVAVFAASAFAEKRPRGFQSWLCVATREAVEFSVKEFVRRRPHRFERAEFEVDGELPAPAV
ncbi:MAG: RES family NAD+ phosphorylase, partial [Acidobacteriota bacterium]